MYACAQMPMPPFTRSFALVLRHSMFKDRPRTGSASLPVVAVGRFALPEHRCEWYGASLRASGGDRAAQGAIQSV